MKKLSLYLFYLLALATPVVLTSCGDDDDDDGTPPAPTISAELINRDGDVFQDSYDGFVGEVVTVEVDITAPGGFNVLTVSETLNGASGNTQTFTRVNPVNDTTFVLTDTLTDSGTLVYTFTATDDENQTTTADFTVNVQDALTQRFSAVLLAAPLGSGDSQTFFSTNDGQIYSVNEVNNTSQPISGTIDFGYFYGQTFQATLASPNEYPIEVGQVNWGVRNDTKLRVTNLSAASFDTEADNNTDYINDAFSDASEGDSPEQARNLGVGQVVAFELAASKGNRRGVMKVTDIQGTDGANGRIELEIVVIEP